MSSLCGVVATQLKDLLGLFFRTLPELLGLPASFLLKKIQKALMELEAMNATLPELPHDVLMNIFATLEIPDLVRAGAVCSSWHSAYTCLLDLGKYKQSQTPCLFYTSESAGENVAFLYSLVENRSYKLTLPEPPIRSRFLIGSSNGWLITADERSELHLVNPITGEQIALPSVVTIEHVKPVFDDLGTIHKYELSYHTAEKVYRQQPELLALHDLREELYYKISFARAWDDKWTWLPHSTGYRLKPGRFKSIYIIQAPWGDLLQIWRTVDVAHEWEDEYGGSPKVRTLKITVYKVDMDAKKLVEMKGLPYHMLFLGHNKSLCLNAEGHPKLKSNHAYFTEDYEELTVYSKNVSRDIGVWDLENCRKKKIVSQIWSNWPCPTWLTPNIVKMNLAFRK
ncbi:hypothetical protein HU200_016427 [Digitaria exilis]|uniref:F-box domain-containing protein n=1 Tax=Digitaria exilis TaxID=1010633 RepID=A0A835F8W1_9POAL|nr:hypothetical protein HU200_016427 [Digitaria exilis]